MVSPPPGSRRVHRVRRGETLQTVAKRYGVSTEELLKANGMRAGRALKTGQELRIPAKPGRSRVVASLAGAPRRYFD